MKLGKANQSQLSKKIKTFWIKNKTKKTNKMRRKLKY